METEAVLENWPWFLPKRYNYKEVDLCTCDEYRVKGCSVLCSSIPDCDYKIRLEVDRVAALINDAIAVTMQSSVPIINNDDGKKAMAAIAEQVFKKYIKGMDANGISHIQIEVKQSMDDERAVEVVAKNLFTGILLTGNHIPFHLCKDRDSIETEYGAFSYDDHVGFSFRPLKTPEVIKVSYTVELSDDNEQN